MRSRRAGISRRLGAATLAALCLTLATPPSALADDPPQGLWARWWDGATHREFAAEIPFAVLVTLPAMLVVTPIWLAAHGYERLTGDEGDEDRDS